MDKDPNYSKNHISTKNPFREVIHTKSGDIEYIAGIGGTDKDGDYYYTHYCGNCNMNFYSPHTISNCPDCGRRLHCVVWGDEDLIEVLKKYGKEYTD